MKYCQNCGAPLNKGDAFCSYCGSPLPKKKKTGLILAACGLLVLLAAAAVLLITGAFKKGEPFSVETEGNYRVAGSDDEAVFKVNLGKNAPETWLCDEEGNQIGRFHDDGKEGDESALDGIYTYVLSSGPIEAHQKDKGGSALDILESLAPGGSSKKQLTNLTRTSSYVIRSGSRKSEPIEITSFVYPETEEQKQAAREYYESVCTEIRAIEAKYRSAEGVIPAEKGEDYADEVENLVRQHQQDGGILRYEREDCYIYIKFTSGITRMVEPLQANVSSGGSEVELTIWAYQPNPDIENTGIPDFLRAVGSEVGNCSYIQNYTGTGVTLNLIKGLPSNEVVFWNGHGGYGPVVKSFLASGEYFDWNAWWWDLGYFGDCVADRIINRSTDNQNELACVTSKFISRYCGDLSNSLFFLASCHSAQDDRLANAFIGKGALAVLGFTETVYTGYCQIICADTLQKMTEINSSTQDYYTLSDALAWARTEDGANDGEWGAQYGYSKEKTAEPKIIGDGNYQLSAVKTVTVYVYDQNAEPVTEGVAVILTDENGGLTAAKKDESGNFTAKVPSGTYRVTAAKTGYVEAEAELTVTQDTYTDLVLTRALTGTYKGWYVASQGKTGVTLEITDGHSGVFTFYNLPGQTNAQSGSYTVDVTYENGEVTISGNEWIDKPSTYSFVTFTGRMSEDGNTFSGKVNNSWDFEVTRQ